LVQSGVPVNVTFPASLPESVKELIRPGETLLMACARLGLESAALFLLEQTHSPVDTTFRLDSGETVFHLAVESELRALCTRLVTKHDVDPNQFRTVQRTCESPVLLPSSLSPDTVVKNGHKLHPVTVPPESVNPFDLFPDDDQELHESCAAFARDPTQMTQRMDPDGQGQPSGDVLETKTPVRMVQCERCTPLHMAILHGLPELIELYLEHKAQREPNWFLLNHDDESAFSLALWNGQFDLANRILIAASKSSYDRTGSVANSTESDVLARFTAQSDRPSLLHRAVTRGQLETVRFLIRHGVDVNESLSDSNFAAHLDTDPNQFVCPLLTALMNHMLPIADLLVRIRSKDAKARLMSIYGRGDND
uniref:ANK_REP_REGION domain-containing protein n=1 Tax=Echinostoma caproni TaxID=27848 RepID=A0A183AIS3_9TREM